MKTLLAPTIPLFALTGLVSACLYIPPVWDIGDAINDVDKIEVGVATKEQVLDLLGEPDRRTHAGNTFHYAGESSWGVIIVAAPVAAPGNPGGGLIGKERWWILIDFDEDGVVEFVTRSDDRASVEARQTEKLRQDIATACKSAAQGHARAQYTIGYQLARDPADRSKSQIPRNSVWAYMWFKLAARNGMSTADDRAKTLARSMSPEQIAEGERLAAEWTPDSPCPSAAVAAATTSTTPVGRSSVAPVDPAESGGRTSRSCTDPAFAD